MRVCVCTVVHHPEDARIMRRQISALLEAGHEVVYIAPFSHCNVTPRRQVTAVDVPRAVGWRRLHALRAARKALRKAARDADLLVVHDPELLFALPRRRPPTVWDVHEDTAGALATKEWVPDRLRRPLAGLVRRLERRAEERVHLLLAEDAYAERFTREHPVVLNTAYVPDRPSAATGRDRVVYVGQLSLARGAADLVEVARLLAPRGVRLELIGAADAEVREMLRQAQREGLLDWYGYVPNERALRMAEGAIAGLSLLHDVPNHRHSLPTKVIEYMARGLPVVTTPLPLPAGIVRDAGCGVVVGYGDAQAVARAVLDLRDDPGLRAAMGGRGHERARARYHWPDHAPEFVKRLESWARAPEPAAVAGTAPVRRTGDTARAR
ncbi:glycosyltransferase [Bailinhaonella thermotolerans]|uniref:Glycosyltransferase n=1 Tax=Bailinhaonella thermotolerans TaxID=1070861 RepID=A0A3A4AT78_9ACTN|nr:glycosyltransferase [Bailinhaonella thermotolerans]RJL30504.1 glycosyltransferase [Bailinhaonella thermotolerans]